MSRWGILATGRIATLFAQDLALLPSEELVAVGSRRRESAVAFAEEYGGTPYSSYEELVRDPEVEVVYIATPHSMHLDNARLAFEHGKHVLCEKPLTLTSQGSAEMIALAREHGRFLMEAMWTACHPGVLALRRRLLAGEFGTPRHLHAELGFVVGPDAGARMVEKSLGASALLDMGIYPLTFAHLLFGPALEARALANLTAGFDMDVAMVGRYAGDVLLTAASSMSSVSSRSAAIATDRGRVTLEHFHHPAAIVWQPHGGEPEIVEPDEPVLGRGYAHEALEVSRCLSLGLQESPLVPWSQTLSIMELMDDLRRQIGVRFTET